MTEFSVAEAGGNRQERGIPMKPHQQNPNDQRSNVKNPNNEAFRTDQANRNEQRGMRAPGQEGDTARQGDVRPQQGQPNAGQQVPQQRQQPPNPQNPKR
ncbi:uncharacterized protein CMC5_059600 [Chondromyces crocatus]|uniref:Uncharacterized protein n=2 Tax=Chondromyces crocatus TaxID=52 RepID=A0A0K1ELI8_CHOCO|nr:uncharacterized protein CMC5_059600 [Chondromyces crocatus]